ncbi:MAG: hypothetical protein WCL14_05415 [Bacteroidota bacterium]
MSAILNKSESNSKAALSLKQGAFYASSIHCSYYSCIQLMLHIMLYKFKLTQDEIDSNADEKGEGSHVYLINFFTTEIDKVNANSRNFNTNITTLKRARRKADYKDLEIIESESFAAIGLSRKVAEELNKFTTNKWKQENI